MKHSHSRKLQYSKGQLHQYQYVQYEIRTCSVLQKLLTAGGSSG